MQNEQDIPIDIHTNKLLDWLINRRHCNREWQKSILTIRQKINNAIQDMPEVEEITQLLAGTYINYFHCCRIVELLKETEASSRNIFGRYSSQRMKDWLEIIKLYEKDNVYLAEAAQLLTRSVNYEVPSLKKQIAKCKQIQEECVKKEADYAKKAKETREDYHKSCRQIGIEGNCVKKELISLLDALPDTFKEISSSIKALIPPARDYYVSFLDFTLQRDFSELCLPVTKHLMTKGNTTMYEFKHGEPPDIVEVTTPVLPLDVDNGSVETPDEQIDFGDFCVPSENGDDRSSSSPSGEFVHVDKDDCKADNGDQIDFGEADADINWDITVESADISVLDNETQGEGGKVARGEDALTVLDNPQTRNSFINELLELECFLKQRSAEIQKDDDVLCANQFQSASSLLQLQSLQEVVEWISVVNDISSQLMSVQMQHLYLIKESSKYVDRLAESLRSKLDLSDKIAEHIRAVNLKFNEALEEQKSLEPKVDLIIKKTKILQSQIEEDISKRYKNRPVNIMGGIKVM